MPALNSTSDTKNIKSEIHPLGSNVTGLLDAQRDSYFVCVNLMLHNFKTAAMASRPGKEVGQV